MKRKKEANEIKKPNEIFVKCLEPRQEALKGKGICPKAWNPRSMITEEGEYIDVSDPVIKRHIERMIAMGNVEIVKNIIKNMNIEENDK